MAIMMIILKVESGVFALEEEWEWKFRASMSIMWEIWSYC